MSAVGASTSQQTQNKGKSLYERCELCELCLLWGFEGVYKVAVGYQNLCIDSKSTFAIFGPDFTETGEVDSPWRMVMNGKHQPAYKVRIKIFSIDKDQLENFENAMLSFNEGVERSRLEEDKDVGNFMRAAWDHAYQKEALYEHQFDAGLDIFNKCLFPPSDWPEEELSRAQVLAKRNGGMWYEADGNGQPRKAFRYLDGRRVNLDRETKEVTLYEPIEPPDSRGGSLSN